MTLKTITAGVTLSLLACLVLASGGVFGQAPAAKSRPAARNGAAGQAVGYAAQPAANAFYALTPACSVDAAQDEESAKLIESDVQMQQESQTLLGQYAEAEGDDEKAQIKEKLAAALGKQFSAQQQLREHEIAKIEARVKKLREAINKRNEAKRSIVDKRLDQLIREAEGLGWNAPAAGPTDAWGVRFFEPDRANYMPATTGRPVYSTAPAPAAR